MKIWRKVIFWLGLVVLFALGFSVRCWNWPQIFHGGQIYFVDADCYSRMTRVEQVLKEPWRPIRTHDFENAPIGTMPHTTAPMDWAVAGLAVALKPFHAEEARDVAGAFISPLLGALLIALLWWWTRRLSLLYGGTVLFLICFSPILVHGFLLGRPDHQSLILLLLGGAWAAELAIWQRNSRGWHLLAAICWALALWTSLFEPLILLVVTGLGRFFVLGKRGFSDRREWLVLFGIVAGSFLFEGWRFHPFSHDEGAEFLRWIQNIGELREATFGQLCRWTGWLLPVAPLLLIYRFWRAKDRGSLALAGLIILTGALSWWEMRWGYFLALAFALALPAALAALPWKPLAWTLFVISLWPVAQEWDSQIFPDENQQEALVEARDDATQLHEVAEALVSPSPSVVLAPWWLSPALAYWSGQHCVAGSSHESLPGIVATAQFYLTARSDVARQILRERHVNYVIAYEPSRIISNSAQIMGVQAPIVSLGDALYELPSQAPDFLRLVFQNQYFKVYEVTGL